MVAYVFLPGFGNSLGEHWQKQWFKKFPNSYWLEQENWSEPECRVWVDCLQTCVQKIHEPIIFISHSLGCLTVVEWVKRYQYAEQLQHQKIIKEAVISQTLIQKNKLVNNNQINNTPKIVGAFLVAVPDPLNSNVPPSIRGYTKYPLTPLPFPSKMIASTNDPYCNVKRSEFFAKNWGSELEMIGAKGHINTNAGFGEWRDGIEIFHQWCKVNNI